ncbi:hypothetical protein Efla_001145 [Eimeria flavescens]
MEGEPTMCVSDQTESPAASAGSAAAFAASEEEGKTPSACSGGKGSLPASSSNFESDSEHSRMQEERMRAFFASDAAALAADRAGAAAAAAAACKLIAAETGQDFLPTQEGSSAAASHECCVRIFRMKDTQAYYGAASLEHRLPMLGADSVDQLCKTIVMENTKHTGKGRSGVCCCLLLICSFYVRVTATTFKNERGLSQHLALAAGVYGRCLGEEDRLNSRYYLVVLQSKDKLNGERVKDLIKAENAKVGRRLGNKKLNFNFCSSFESLTGFKRNGVCPFASKTPLPVILSRPVLNVHPKVVFLGGGAPDLKVAISVVDLLRITQPLVGDVC